MHADTLAREVHRIHDRYLVEVVEDLGICPFARKSREQGRVCRPLVHLGHAPPQPASSAHMLAERITTQPDLEIVLLTYIGRGPGLAEPERFEAHLEPLRAAYRQATASAPGLPGFFMVAFHPGGGASCDRLTRDSFVPLLRRSPDPVVQCVRIDVLERVRRQAQASAHARRLALVGDDPTLRTLLANSIQTDCELSTDIAQHNFDAIGHGSGRAELERRLAAIMADRELSYGAWLRSRPE